MCRTGSITTTVPKLHLPGPKMLTVTAAIMVVIGIRLAFRASAEAA